MKKICLFAIAISLLISSKIQAQTTGSIVVGGDINSYYPVTFYDGGWSNNASTELELGRSIVHQDASWRGALIAKFSYHVTNWGNGASFINAFIQNGQSGPVVVNQFIAGWTDATASNGTSLIVIWLRGGSTSYTYHSNYACNPVVYDGTANPLPLQILNQPAYNVKTQVDGYVNSYGQSISGNQVFMGNVGIGTTNPQQKLAVNGTIQAREVNVTTSGWPDYVFTPEHQLPSLETLATQIKEQGHLPNIPSAEEVSKNGIALGEMNKKLLEKVEELTLYAIKQNEESKRQKEMIEKLLQRIEKLENKK